jgi:pimeloyl-ACP methyl ester carboxylesterase
MITYNYAEVHGRKMYYCEAGDKSAPTIVLLHGFPSSSHMYRNLIPQLADAFHVIASDYIGFGYSDAPDVAEYSYTFDNLATHVEELLFGVLGLKQSSIYVQDYGSLSDDAPHSIVLSREPTAGFACWARLRWCCDRSSNRREGEI